MRRASDAFVSVNSNYPRKSKRLIRCRKFMGFGNPGIASESDAPNVRRKPATPVPNFRTLQSELVSDSNCPVCSFGCIYFRYCCQPRLSREAIETEEKMKKKYYPSLDKRVESHFDSSTYVHKRHPVRNCVTGYGETFC